MSAAAADLPSAATRRERRKERKKQRRRRARRESAALARAAAEALAANPEEERRLRELEEAEAEASERARCAFEDAERRWLEASASRAAERAAAAAAEEAKAPQASSGEKYKDDHRAESEEDDEWEYVEDGPAEIIWQGNEIIVKKNKVKVPKKANAKPLIQEDRPTSNPLPPQSVASSSQRREPALSAQEVLEKVAQETPNFGTEQDKAHCPFHLKTAACRFGVRCSRVHFYPDKSCTLLMKNMYNGPGLALEQDEGLECTDEEVEQSYEEFYEDVHTEFLKFGELVNFKVCRNGSFHLRGNVYVHYKSLDSALLAYNSMNGRYFAGKQITCEFVAVTRWKAAICGEFMRSRFKTCSHGVACNFIHCFRNPGGDYEWADWDNPPPKYWARKMTALFGSSPSDAAAYGKASNTPEFEWSQTSDRKRLRSSDDRYVSSGSRDGHAHPGHSSRDYSHSKQARSRHRTKHEHNLHRREPSTANRQQGQEIGDNTGTMEKEKVPHTPTRAERYRSDHPDGGKRYDNNIRSRKHRSEHPETAEPGSSDRPSEFTNAGISKNDSGSTSVGRHSSRRQSLDDSSSSLKGHYSSAHKSSGKEHNTKRSSRRYIEDDSYDEKDDRRGKSRKDRIGEDSCDEKDGGRSKSRKDRIGDDCYDEKGGGRSKSRKDVCDDVDDRWLATNSDVDSDVEIQYRRSRSRDRESRKDNAYSHVDTQHQRSGSRTTKLGTKDDKITRTKKHHNESRRHNGSDEDTPDSTDLSSRTRSRSRSSEEDRSSHISRRKRSHRSHDS